MKIKNKVSAKLLGSAMLSTVIFISSCQKEDNILPSEMNAQELSLNNSLDKLAATSVPNGFYDLTKSLPKGYVKDGSVDYTAYIQKAVNSYSKVAFPGFPILVNDNGIKVPSNRYLTFLDKSEIILKPTSKSNYDIFRLENVSNVTFANPVIKGDRYKHQGTSGEWGHGIGVYGSTNINISKPEISECWGDGIYIAGNSRKHYSENIRIFKPTLTSNRRDGISVISVNGLEMTKPYIANSNGTSPFCGINIEPDNYSDEIKGVVISSPTTVNNLGSGIQIGLTKMYGKASKKVDILITDHTDIGSGIGLKSVCRTTRRAGSEIMSGKVTAVNPNWKKNTVNPLYAYSADPNFTISISKPRLTTVDGISLATSEVKQKLEHKKVIWEPTVYNLTF